MRSIAIFPSLAGGQEMEGLAFRKALGRNLFDAGDWMRYYGQWLGGEMFVSTPPFPWDVELLDKPCPFMKGKRIKDTHFGFLGIETAGGEPLTLVRFEGFHPKNKKPHFDSGQTPWYLKEAFAREITCGFRWYLLLQQIVPGSENLTYAEQEKMLPEEYEPPLALIEAVKGMLYYRKHFFRPYLNGSRWARCKDILSDGGHPEVGCHDRNGLSIGKSAPDVENPDVGIGAARRLP